MTVFRSVEEIAAATGRPLGPTEWMAIDQPLIDAFADLTGDRQWIHTDVARAAAGPFGGTVAHGYLLEALIPRFSAQLITVTGATAGVNAGSDRVRFLQPVTAGSRIRARAQVTDATPRGDGARIAIRFEYELDGADRPAMIADTVRIVTF
ncbi:MaoC family dehydratase [Dietzia aurantiaca]|uniref:MaoC family dehydratase n=1 Tax=Dietzia aurantiaca TaxID=983873 RepID=A0ABV9PM43_9ACTN